MPLEDVHQFLSQDFTHIVVGGGTAGLVVAHRLSEASDTRVGVLEAGSSAIDDPRINVPGRFGEALGTELDWQFETTEQPGLDGRRLPFPRGKVLGGSSALNFMTWNRGCKEDYDAWEHLGNPGWGWDGILPYFKRAENFHEPTKDHQKDNSLFYEPKFHGKGGPMHNTYSATYGASHKHWHQTLNNLGVSTNDSHFSGSNVGCWTTITAVSPEKRDRCYSATAYYLPARGRQNLHLLTDALAQEVMFEQEGQEWRAKGVRFIHNGEEHVVKTKGEVIICGGSVSSPQLLELSGIGAPDVLEAAGISCKINNHNVGENFQEHMMTAMIYEISPSIATPEDLRSDAALAAAADKEYVLTQSGPRTVIPSSVSYLPFSHLIPTSSLRELGEDIKQHPPSTEGQLPSRDQILTSRFTKDQNLGQIEFYFDISNYSPFYPSEPGKKYGTMLMMLQYPFSRGSMHIPPLPPSPQLNGHSNHNGNSNGNPASNGIPAQTKSPKSRTTAEDKPLINPRYYLDRGGAVDFKLMCLCQRFADKICRTAPLSSIIERRVFPPAASPPTSQPSQSTNCNGNGAQDKGTGEVEEEEDFSDWIRNTTITDWHPIGTCSMGGHEGIEAGVVDARLKVYGTQNVRVCDASVMPLQIAAHLQATVYAIAEKGAEMMKEDWARSRLGRDGVES